MQRSTGSRYFHPVQQCRAWLLADEAQQKARWFVGDGAVAATSGVPLLRENVDLLLAVIRRARTDYMKQSETHIEPFE